MQVRELAQRIGVPYRDVRYVLEQGIIPEGVEESPGRGEHRDLTPSQAFWLAVVLCLKQSGIKTPEAREIADHACLEMDRSVKHQSSDFRFNPFRGEFDAENRWFVDVGDMKYIKIIMGQSPDKPSRPVFPWRLLGKREFAENVEPVVVIRIDLTRLVSLIEQKLD